MTRLINNVRTAALLGLLMGLCMAIGYLLGGAGGMLFGLLFGGVGNFIAYWFSDRLALKAMRAHEVTREEAPWLVNTVERLARRANLPMPRVYVSAFEAPNAFATGRNPKNAAVAVTEGMLNHFSKSEVEGVLAHELAHIKHRDILITTIAAVMAGVITYAAHMVLWFGGSSDEDSPLGAFGAILMVLLAPIAAMIIQMAISRAREYSADAYAGELTGDPRMLARALERLQALNERIPTRTEPALNSLFIVQPLAGRGGLAALFSTHPPTELRIARLYEQAGQTGRAGQGQAAWGR